MHRRLTNSHSNPKLFFACLLSFVILMAPLASVGAATLEATPQPTSKKQLNASEEVKPLLAQPAPVAALPAPVAAPLAAPAPLAPLITASKTDSFSPATDDADSDGRADPGDTITYITTIGNTGPDDATHVKFTDLLSTSLTLVPGSVNTSPLALADTYAGSGNIPLSVAAPGVLTNDFDPDNGSNSGLTVTQVQSSGANVGVATDTNATGRGGVKGKVTLAANGGFSYEPPPGFEGADTFTYTVSDGTATNSDTVTINITQMVWFIQNNAGGLNQGTFSNPFTTIASFNTANAGTGAIPDPKNNDFISLRQGTGTYSEVDGINLRDGQKLIGNAVMFSSVFTAAPNSSSAYTTFAGGTTTAPVIVTSGGNGVDLALSNTVRGLNVGNSGSFYDFNGSAVGSPIINTVSLTGDGGAIRVSTSGAFGANVVFGTFESTSAPGGSNVALTGVTGTLGITSAGSGLAGSQNTIDAIIVSGGSVSFTYAGNITKSNGGALLNVNGAHTGTLTFNTGTISATGGTGLQFTNADGSYDFNSTTTLNGGDAGIDIFNGSGGTFDFGAATITNPTGIALNVDGSTTPVTGGITISGAIQKTNVGNTNRLIDFNNYDSAGTANISGALTCNNGCQGIEVTNDGTSSGIVNFSNATKTLNTSTSTAINLDNNDGGQINFTGNGLDVDTTTGAGLSATNGGTVTVTGTGNSLLSTTGTALNVVSTTIGAGGLTFERIDSNGGTNGIVLNTTGSGGLTVTGVGTTAGTGGTIQVKDQGAVFTSAQNISLKNMNFTNANTGDSGGVGFCDNTDPISGGIYNLSCKAAINMSSVTTVSFDNLFLDRTIATGGEEVGINGRNVSGLTILNSTVQNYGDEVNEGEMRLFNLTGTCAFTNSAFKFGSGRSVEIRNASAATLNLTISSPNSLATTNSIFSDTQTFPATGNDGLEIKGLASGVVMNVDITNTRFLRNITNGMQAISDNSANMTVNVKNCHFDRMGGTGKALDFDADNNGVLKFNVNANPIMNSGGGAGGTVANFFSDRGGLVMGHIRDNPSIVGGGVGFGGSGIVVQVERWGSGIIDITNNTVSGIEQDSGINTFARARAVGDPSGANPVGGTYGRLDVTIDDNNVTIGNAAAYNVVTRAGGGTATDANVVCGNVKNNTTVRGAGAIAAYQARVANTNSDLILQGFTTNEIVTWNNNLNTPINDVDNFSAESAVAGTCVTPTNPIVFNYNAAPRDDLAKSDSIFSNTNTDLANNYHVVGPWTANLGLDAKPNEFAPHASHALASLSLSNLGRLLSGLSNSSPKAPTKRDANASLFNINEAIASVSAKANAVINGLPISTRDDSNERIALAQDVSRSTDGTTRLNAGRTNQVKLNHVARIRTVPTAPALLADQVVVDGGAGVTPANSGFTLPSGKTITITFKATLNNPPNVVFPYPSGGAQVSNQGTVTADGPITVLTDDPTPGGGSDPTVTLVDLFNSQTTVAAVPTTGTTSTSITLTATVKVDPAQVPAPVGDVDPTGTVKFQDGGVDIPGCTAQPLTGTVNTNESTATCTTTFSPSGTHAITAIYSADGNYDTSTSGAQNVTIIDPPTITKSFLTNPIPLNTTTTMRFTITNPNASSSLSGIQFTDTLPAGMTVATTATTPCGGNLATTSPSTVSFTNGTLAGGASCDIDVTVTGVQAGAHLNQTGNISSTEGGTGTFAQATLTVVAPPVIAKSFTPANTTPGGSSVLTFTISNPVGNTVTLTGVSFTDTFPAGIQVAAVPNVQPAANQCGAGSTVMTTSGSVTLSGGSIATGGQCTFTVDVTATTGGLNQVTVNSTNGGTGNTASATLTTCVAPPAGLTNWWTGDTADLARDIAGGKDGTLVGDTTYAPGKVKEGFSFDGTGDYVDVGDVDLGSTFTLDAWINPTSLTDATTIVAKYGTSMQSYAFGLTNLGHLELVVVSAAGITYYRTASAVVSTGSLQHVAVTYDGGAAANNKMVFYYNGAVVASAPIDGVSDNGGTPNNLSLSTRIGANEMTGGPSAFTGIIDEVEFFNTVVSAADIFAVYNAGAGGKCKVADLVITKTHTDPFVQGSSGNTYTITVTNHGPEITSGTTTVTDTLPAGLTATAMSGTGWTCAPVPPGPFPVAGPATLQCTSTQAVAAGGSFNPITLTVTAGVDMASVINNVSVSGNELDTSDNTASDTTNLTPSANISLTKSDSPDPVTAGSNLVYTITVDNAGPSTASTVAWSDPLPAGTTFVSLSAPGGWSCTTPAVGANGTVNCSIASLSVGSAVFTLTVAVGAGVAAGTVLSNTATSTSATSDPTPGNESDTETTTVGASADMQVTKTDSPDPVTAGSNLTYTITVTNAGPSNAATASLSDTLPAGTTFVSLPTVSGWSCTTPAVGATGTVSCSNPSFAPGSSVFTLTVNVDSNVADGTVLSNTANVSSVTNETAPGNESATTTTTVAGSADLQVTKTDSADPVTAGNNLTYTITVTNAGPSNAATASLNDTLPTGTTFVSLSSPGGWTCSTPAVGGVGSISCSNPSLAPGASVFTLVVNVGAGVAAGTVLSNTATAASTTPDPSTGNESATQTTTVAASADMQVTKTDSPDPVTAGTNLTYTITVTNAGPSNAAAASLSDTLPAGTTFVSLASPGGWSCTTPAVGASGTVSCSNASFAPGPAAFTLVVAVDPSVAAGTVLSNTATVSSTTPDPSIGNESATATTTVAASADLSITKTDSPDPVTAGSNLTYTITVTNAGPSNAATANMSDTLPAGTTFVSLSSPGGWTCTTPAVGSGGTVSCSNASAGLGSSVFTLVVAVGSGVAAATIISNTATVTSATTDPSPGLESATATTTVVTSADLLTVKVASPDPNVVVGNDITYTITVTNGGASDAQTLSLSDAIPANTTLVSFAVPVGWTRTDVIPSGGTGTVTATAPSMVSGTQAVFTLVVNVNVGTPHNTVITNSATVSSTTVDPNPGNNTGQASTTVVANPDMTITKTHVGNFTPGGSHTYTITATNSGPGPTNGSPVTVTDTVPVGLTPTGPNGAHNGWACTLIGQNLTCTRSDVLAGMTSYPSITLSVNVANPAPLSVTNTATVAGGGEVNTSNNTASDVTIIPCTEDPSQNNTSPLMISRFRMNGPAGTQDEFVEIYNPATTAHTVATGNCTGGYSVVATAGNGTTSNGVTQVCAIPNGTVIPAGGYYLCTGATYSLSNLGFNGGAAGATAVSDAPIGCGGSCTNDIPNDAGLALVNVGANTVTLCVVGSLNCPTGFNFSSPGGLGNGNLYDRVGFGPYGVGAPPPGNGYPSLAGNFCEGAACLQPVGDVSTGAPCSSTPNFPVVSAPPACYGQAGQYELLRRQTTFNATLGTVHQDTNNSANDWILVAPNSAVNMGLTVTGVSGVSAVLGAAGMQGSTAPGDTPSTKLTQAPFDSVGGYLGPRNAERFYSQDPGVSVDNNPLGTFAMRLRFTNNSGANISGLRFRVENVSTVCGPQGTLTVGSGNAKNLSSTPDCGTGALTSILKLLNSTQEVVVDSASVPQTVQGTVMEDLSAAPAPTPPGAGPLSPNGGGVDNSLVLNPSTSTASTGDGVTGGSGVFSTVITTGSPGNVVRLKIKFGVVKSGRFILLITPMAKQP